MYNFLINYKKIYKAANGDWLNNHWQGREPTKNAGLTYLWFSVPVKIIFQKVLHDEW